MASPSAPGTRYLGHRCRLRQRSPPQCAGGHVSRQQFRGLRLLGGGDRGRGGPIERLWYRRGGTLPAAGGTAGGGVTRRPGSAGTGTIFVAETPDRQVVRDRRMVASCGISRAGWFCRSGVTRSLGRMASRHRCSGARLTASGSDTFRLVAQEMSNVRACREVGVHRITGTRWLGGRNMVDNNGRALE
jgi:hypothetical protein